MNDTVFRHAEADLPRRFGNINRKALRELRQKHLLPDIEWALRGARVMLNDEGLKKIAALLQVELDPPLPSADQPAGAQAAAIESLLVWRVNLPNPHIILCYRAGTDPAVHGNLLRVRVKSSANFLRYVHQKPMEVPVRHLQADLYELARACPRWKGRW